MSHAYILLSETKKRKDAHMTHKKGTTVQDQLQTTLLNEQNLLAGIIHGCLQELIKSEFDRFINAQPHERIPERRGVRNGSYTRTLKTRIGTLDLTIYRDRQGEFRTEFFSVIKEEGRPLSHPSLRCTCRACPPAKQNC